MSSEAYSFFLALFEYSLAIMAHKATGKLKPWMMWLFGVGLLTDAIGTIFACVLTVRGWRWSTHAAFGLAAWLIMAVHFIWGLAALKQYRQWAESFNRWSLLAWLVWVYAFVSGIPTTSEKQLISAAVIIVVFGVPALAYWALRGTLNWVANKN